jgi:hypothetical protein
LRHWSRNNLTHAATGKEFSGINDLNTLRSNYSALTRWGVYPFLKEVDPGIA